MMRITPVSGQLYMVYSLLCVKDLPPGTIFVAIFEHGTFSTIDGFYINFDSHLIILSEINEEI